MLKRSDGILSSPGPVSPKRIITDPYANVNRKKPPQRKALRVPPRKKADRDSSHEGGAEGKGRKQNPVSAFCKSRSRKIKGIRPGNP
ncbi:hypothetical protein B4135_0058 [Caldibacillus debilis]|uniref:Uncharacterized protein n=1 Tax=Caldibacillus debilis TaxID=301148 RepID=A0A150M3B5_9BACI|nr:hypothetical protein B4135_0058 [Caldibacillus debilis]